MNLNMNWCVCVCACVCARARVCVTYGSYEIGCFSECMRIHIIHSHTYINYIFLEEETHIVRADGGRRDISYIIYFWRKGLILHGLMVEDVVSLYLYYILLEERTRIALTECEDLATIYIWWCYTVCVVCLILDSYNMTLCVLIFFILDNYNISTSQDEDNVRTNLSSSSCNSCLFFSFISFHILYVRSFSLKDKFLYNTQITKL